jgi:hypothetical protein
LTSAAEQTIAKDFFFGIEANGVVLTPEAKTTFGYFFASLINRGVAYTFENLVEALDRLVSLGVFVEPRDLTGFLKFQPKPTPKPVAQPKPPTFDDILDANSAESREGRKVLVNAADREYSAIGIPMFQEWAAHLSRDYKGFAISQEDAEYIIDFMFPRNNWSFLQGDNYNKARRAMVSQGKWPESMLTPVERITKELENIPTSDPRYREAQQRLRNAEAAERSKTA